MNLQEMVVTNAEGKIQTADGKDLTGQCIQSEDMYSFYAIKQVNDPAITPAPEKLPAKVRLTMPTGGDLNGLYRFPRVGEKILVVVEGISHYLMSYLPTAENPFSPQDDDKKKTEPFDKQGQILRYKKTGANASDSTYSEIGFYSETTEWKTDDGDSDPPSVDKIKVSSTGDIETRAQNFNETHAQRILLESKFLTSDNIKDGTLKERKTNYEDIGKGDVVISADRRIILDAREGVLLKCGPVSVALSQSALNMCCGKLGQDNESFGPFDSGLALGSNGQVLLQGKRFMGTFDRGVSWFDGFGACWSMMMGRTSFSGSAVSLEASTTLSAIFNATVGVSNLIAQTASLFSSSTAASEVANQIYNASFFADKIASFYTETAGEEVPKKTVDYVTIAMDIVYNTFDSIRTVLERKRAVGYMVHYDPVSKKYYNDDERFKTWAACMITDMTLQTTLIGILLGSSIDAVIHKASIELTPHASIVIDSRTYQQANIDQQEAQEPLAGVGNEEAPKKVMQKIGAAVKKRGADMAQVAAFVANLETKRFATYFLDEQTEQALKEL